MEVNGKVYRNLEGQVGYLTDKYDDLQNQINDVRSHLTHYVVVDTLPTGDDIDPSAVYLLGPMGTAPDQYYEEWVYVQKADESWMWEKLGDTDSVDLSGYLEKVETSTEFQQVYAKNEDGTQAMVDLRVGLGFNSAVKRDAAAQINVPQTPTADNHATSKKYVDDKCLAKQTGTGSYVQAYVKQPDGTQAMVALDANATANTIALRASYGAVKTADPVNASDAVNKGYAESHFLAKQTATSTYQQLYTKKADGTQDMLNVATAEVAYAVPVRTVNGTVRTDTPQVGKDAANKDYVDAVVGQLLYLHEIDLRYTISASITLGIKCYLVNGDSTAITSLTRSIFKRITASYGALNPDANDTVACAITKMPNDFRQSEFDEPYASFLYQYYSGGSLTSGNTFGITPTVTDVVVSF